MYKFYNPNPSLDLVGDCVIRALSLALDLDWKKTYLELAVKGYQLGDMPSSNAVWGAYLKSKGFRRYIIPNNCPDCYNVEDFAYDHPYGTYVLATGTHAVTCIDGTYYDTWDSGKEIPIYYWTKEE
ncbi:MAG: hypothetical protein J6Y02_23695 [Pseudobutyrivibrio sp.]|nr:hypothetical protein [Pseudobutyrivibrio sp.]